MIRSPKIRLMVGFLVGLTVVITFAPSLAARLLLEQQLRTLGATQVTVRVFHLDLWQGRLTLKGLRAEAPDQPLLVIGELVADVAYGALFEQQFHLTELHLQGAMLPLREQSGVWQLGPLQLPLPANDGTPDRDTTPSAWRWGLSNVQVSGFDLEVDYQQADHRLLIEHLKLPSLYQWAPENLSQIQLRGALNGSPFDIDGNSTPLSAQPGAETRVSIDQLRLGPLLALWQPEHSATLSLDLALKFKLDAPGSFTVATDGIVKIGQLHVQQPGLKAEAAQVDWQGQSELQLDSSGLRSSQTRGQLAIERLGLALKGQQTEATDLDLRTDLSLTIDLNLDGRGEELQLSQQSELELSGLRLTQPERALSGERIQWAGSSEQQLNADGLQRLRTDGQLSLAGVNLKQPELELQQQALSLVGTLDTDGSKQLAFDGDLRLTGTQALFRHLDIKSATQNWHGQLGIDLAGAELVRLTGNYALNQLKLAAREGAARLALTRLKLEEFSLSPTYQLSSQRLSLEGLTLAESSPLLDLDQLTLTKLNAGPAETAITDASLGGLDTKVTLDENRQPQAWLDWIAGISGTPSESTPTPAGGAQENPAPAPASERGYPFKLDKLALSAPLNLRVEDQRVKAGRPLSLTINTLDLQQINTETTGSTTFKIGALVNRFGTLDTEGEYSLFADPPSGRWQAEISQLELPPFSPYMNIHTGYQISNGQLQLTSDGDLANGNLKSSNRLLLNRFEVERGSSDAAGEFDGQLGMPLELAVSILTDEDDNVALDIPIQGALNDPEFGIQSVINILMGKVIKEGAVGYLSFVLQPYGALLSLGRMALDAVDGAAIALEPVPFDPGAAELSKDGQDYLDKLAGLLEQRPALKLKLCGHAVGTDSLYLNTLAQRVASTANLSSDQVLTAEQHDVWLYNLAQLRGEEVKSYLQADAGISGQRLFSCLPRGTADSEEAPRVQVGL